jgi:tripartite ATP-independent transporter DctP family solute receptor
MKNKIHCLIALMVVSLFFASSPAFCKMTIKVAHIDPADRLRTNMHSFASSFKDFVENQSRGEMEVQIYPAGQLGGMREMVESTKLGATQVVITFTAVSTVFCPEFAIMQTPYTFPTALHAWYVADGWMGKELAEEFEKKTKLKVLSYGEAGGYHHLFTNKRQITSPANLKGFRLRVPLSKGLFRFFEAQGAQPMSVPWNEVYTAMKTGTVDGLDGTINTVVDSKLYETFKYTSLIGHFYDVSEFLINASFFDSLSKDQKRIISTGARIGAIVSRGTSRNNEGASLDVLKSKGVKVYIPTQAEMSQFAKYRDNYLQYMEETIGKEWVDKLNRATKEAHEALD